MRLMLRSHFPLLRNKEEKDNICLFFTLLSCFLCSGFCRMKIFQTYLGCIQAYLSAIVVYLYAHDFKEAEKCYNDCSQ